MQFNERIFNFSPGPAILPTEVLEQARLELLNYKGTGMSVMEISHRHPIFLELFEETRRLIRELMNLDDDFEVLLLQGGSRLQFCMIPLNFLQTGHAEVIHSGYWTKLAQEEFLKIGESKVIASSEGESFFELPCLEDAQFSADANFLYYCSNNTIYGTQWTDFLNPQKVPLIADMSSDILSRHMNFNQFSLIYACAQKNLGPAGVTLVAVRKSFVEKASNQAPYYLQYKKHIEADSMYNTPPTLSIYFMNLCLKWLKTNGGLDAAELRNREKATFIYDYLDQSKFFTCPIRKSDRSHMNIVFRISNGDELLEDQFVKEAHQLKLFGLKGHRIAGGLRASCYNALSFQAVQALVEFMQSFESRHL